MLNNLPLSLVAFGLGMAGANLLYYSPAWLAGIGLLIAAFALPSIFKAQKQAEKNAKPPTYHKPF